MTSEYKKRIQLFRILTLITSSLSLGLLTLLVWFQMQHSSELENLVSGESLRELKDVVKAKEALLQADETWFIEQDAQKALSQYQALLEAPYPKEKDIIERRLEAIKMFLKGGMEDQSMLENYEEMLDLKAKELDSIKESYVELRYQLLEMENRFSTSKDSLIALIADKNRQLQRKEKVRVITFVNESGNRIHYLGEVENEQANGGGIGIWNTGSIYRGEWRNNLRHGKGLFEWADGDKYEGNFTNGIREGQGIYWWKSGERYEGEFKNNRRNGRGTLFDPDGNISFEGMWSNDKPQVR